MSGPDGVTAARVVASLVRGEIYLHLLGGSGWMIGGEGEFVAEYKEQGDDSVR